MTEKKEYLETEFAYHKYKMQVREESRKAYLELQQALDETYDVNELRDTAKIMAKSAFEQACENYDFAICAAVCESKYKRAIAFTNLITFALLISNLIWLIIIL